MPVYDVEHKVRLSNSQMDQIAEAITKIHSEAFKTPRGFVNVNFRDIDGLRTYVGGKQKSSNRIIANVRHGPSRTQAMYDELCFNIIEAWNAIVGGKGDDELRAVFVLGSIVAGVEAGFTFPQAGHDAQWVKENFPKFKKRADEGDADFKAMIEEFKGRPEFSALMAN